MNPLLAWLRRIKGERYLNDRLIGRIMGIREHQGRSKNHAYLLAVERTEGPPIFCATCFLLWIHYNSATGIFSVTRLFSKAGEQDKRESHHQKTSKNSYRSRFSGISSENQHMKPRMNHPIQLEHLVPYLLTRRDCEVIDFTRSHVKNKD